VGGLVSIIRRLGGTPKEQDAWFTENVELMVCVVAKQGLPTRRQNIAALRETIIRYRKQEIRNPGGKKPHRSFAEQDADSIKRKLGIADD
jgi:hypothetical protein